jgi:hypothetical protein
MDTQLIITLAQARANHDAAYQVTKALEDAFKVSPEWLEAAKKLEQSAVALNQADADFRQEALAEFGNTGKKQADAYEVKVTRSVTIPDEGAAVRWSITNFTPALSLNKKVFEAAVKAGSIPGDIAFALDTPKVFVKSDLSEWLPKEGRHG